MPLPSAKRTAISYAAVGSPFMAAVRSTGPAIPSGSLSVGGIAIIESLWLLPEICWSVGIEPVISEFACGIATEAVASEAPLLLSDCLPIGVGEVICGVTWSSGAGAAPFAAGGWLDGCGSLAVSAAGAEAGAGLCPLEPSSSDIAILNVPSTMTTTLAATST